MAVFFILSVMRKSVILNPKNSCALCCPYIKIIKKVRRTTPTGKTAELLINKPCGDMISRSI